MTIDFEQILGLSPNPYVLLDTELVIVWMNDAYLRATMRERESIIGHKMFDAFPSEGESYQLLASSFEQVLATGEADEIALIRYPIEGRDGTIDTRYWSATHTPIYRDGSVEFILQHTVDVTEVEKLRQSRDEMGIMRRAQSVQAENRSLKNETRMLVDFFEHAPSFTAVLIGPDHRFGMANKAYCGLVGRDDLIGKTVAEALPEVVEQGFITLLDNVYQSGKPYLGQQEKVSLATAEGMPPQDYVLNFVYQPIFDNDDKVTGIIVQGHDVTEEVQSLERQGVLVNELNHRVKNTLAIVQGLATQSLNGREADQGRTIFNARLRALAAAHNLLTEAYWSKAQVEEIVRVTSEAAVGESIRQFELEGDQITLAPQAAVALTMIIHELCTNALKYGALSSQTGRVKVRWKRDLLTTGCFTFSWEESGGPAVETPQSTGFGTRLISRGIDQGGEDSAIITFDPKGLRYSMRAGYSQQ